MINQDLLDEIESINAIYTASTLQPVHPEQESQERGVTICTLLLPGASQIRLRLAFPDDYPDSAPCILGTESVGAHVPKGLGKRVVELSREVLGVVFSAGSACVFALVEELCSSSLHHLLSVAEADDGIAMDARIEQGVPYKPELGRLLSSSKDTLVVQESSDINTHSPPLPPPAWSLSDPVTEKKSLFLARAAKVASPAVARAFLSHLLTTDRRVARATHNVSAWRIRGGAVAGSGGSNSGSSDSGGVGSTKSIASSGGVGTTKSIASSGGVGSTKSIASSGSSGGTARGGICYQDCDDDGETAAGGRLLHLLQLMDVWDVVVVVSRWYGGVKLGPDRFRIINSVARAAVVRLGGG